MLVERELISTETVPEAGTEAAREEVPMEVATVPEAVGVLTFAEAEQDGLTGYWWLAAAAVITVAAAAVQV
jgi:hypothetical protein